MLRRYPAFGAEIEPLRSNRVPRNQKLCCGIVDFTALLEAEPNSAAVPPRAHAYSKAGKDWKDLADNDRALALKPDDADAADTKARRVGKRADAISVGRCK